MSVPFTTWPPPSIDPFDPLADDAALEDWPPQADPDWDAATEMLREAENVNEDETE